MRSDVRKRLESIATIDAKDSTAIRQSRRRFLALCGALPAGFLSLQRAEAADRFKPFALRSLAGETRTLPEVMGNATLVVFFFPTCPYCNAALPETQKIYDTFKDRGLSMVWINVVPREEPLIEGWLTAHGFAVPVLLGNEATLRDYSVTTTPTHVLLDAGGRVLAKRTGYSKGDEQTLARLVQRALEPRHR